jgi:hypothetical protein
LSVFLKVLNEMQGYCPEHPHIAHMERYLTRKALRPSPCLPRCQWHRMDRRAGCLSTHRDEVVEAWSAATARARGRRKVDGWGRREFFTSVENFCTWVKAYLDKQGQSIASSSWWMRWPVHRRRHPPDAESPNHHREPGYDLPRPGLGRGHVPGGHRCRPRRDETSAANDFSKIQGRFKTRLSPSSANVDEVIQERLLAKRPE